MQLVVDYFASCRLVIDYVTYAARPGASARDAARRVARRRLLRLRRASGFLGTSHGLSRRSSSPTPTTSRVRVPRHIARLVTRLVAPLVVDYSTSRGLVIDYLAYTARPGASARRAARRVACRRLLRLAPLVVDYLAYAARPGASGRRTACHAACRAARRRLHRLCRVSECLGTSRGSSCGSSLTTSPTSRVRVPRQVARLVMRLVVDYSVHRDFVLRPQWLYFSHMVHRDYLPRGNTGSTSSTLHTVATSSSGRIKLTIHLE
jgi:hypothetical protein